MMNWNQIKQELADAILSRDVARIGEIVDQLRFCGKLNYDEQYALAHELTGVSAAAWDELLYETDLDESRRTDTLKTILMSSS